jgi:hypothetical protein
MGKITFRRADGTTGDVRTSVKTKHVRLAHENPVAVDLSAIGDTPTLAEMSLNYKTVLERFDATPLAGHPALSSLSLDVAEAFDLAPLASCPKLSRLAMNIGGSRVPDMAPFQGHATLASVSIDCRGSQPSIDLSFVRDLPALEDISISGGDWKTLDLEPLRGLALRSVGLHRQYTAQVDLALLAQPALEHLYLQDLEIKEGYLDLFPLAKCTKLRQLSLLGAEIGTLEVSGLAKLQNLHRFDPPNVKQMMMMASAQPITAPGLKAWSANIGVDD